MSKFSMRKLIKLHDNSSETNILVDQMCEFCVENGHCEYFCRGNSFECKYRWIPSEFQTPEDGSIVTATINSIVYPSVEFKENCWHLNGSKLANQEDVSAWMPIIEPYTA